MPRDTDLIAMALSRQEWGLVERALGLAAAAVSDHAIVPRGIDRAHARRLLLTLQRTIRERLTDERQDRR